MRVGVLLGDKLPEEGGGYTFEQDLLQSLMTAGDKTDHTFIILSQGKYRSCTLSAPHIEILSLYRNWVARAGSQLYQTAKAILTKLRRPSIPFRIAHWAEPAILRSGVDIIWHLTPTWLTAEIPSIVIVWELQHRLQPYFPEMSIQGEWDERDQSTATILRRAAFVIAGTEAGKSEIERFYQIPSERIKILPHPTPRYALEASPTDGEGVLDKYAIPDNYVFYPAQFWSHKNHANLILAMQWLRDHAQLELPLVLAGSDKGNEPYIRQLVTDLGLNSQVYFIGFVPPDDLVALYRHAFCLAYITLCGPENLPPLEAFALGCPVVASSVSGAHEQLGHAALLVDPTEPPQMAQAILSLLDNTTLRQTLIERGYERAGRFTGEDFVSGVFDLLNTFGSIRRCWSQHVTYRPIKESIQHL